MQKLEKVCLVYSTDFSYEHFSNALDIEKEKVERLKSVSFYVLSQKKLFDIFQHTKNNNIIFPL